MSDKDLGPITHTGIIEYHWANSRTRQGVSVPKVMVRLKAMNGEIVAQITQGAKDKRDARRSVEGPGLHVRRRHQRHGTEGTRSEAWERRVHEAPQHERRDQDGPHHSSPSRMNHYETLGVERGAMQGEIRAAFRKLASANHPDKFSDPAEAKEAEQRMTAISVAYDVLFDAEKRKRYDETGEYGVQETEEHFGRAVAMVYFMQAVSQSGDDEDMLGKAIASIIEELDQTRYKIEAAQSDIEILGRRANRFVKTKKAKADDTNWLRNSILQRIELLQAAQDGLKETAQRFELALDFLRQYRDTGAMAPPAIRVSSMAWTPTGGSW